jgi:hypothetical protein
MMELVSLPPEDDSAALAQPDLNLIGDIDFDAVRLRYSVDAPPALDMIDLHLPAGQSVGICVRSPNRAARPQQTVFRVAPALANQPCSARSSRYIRWSRVASEVRHLIVRAGGLPKQPAVGGHDVAGLSKPALRRAMTIVPQVASSLRARRRRS